MNPMLIMMALQAGQGLMGYQQSRQNYKATEKAYRRNVRMINEEYRESFADNLSQALQQLMSLKTTLEDQARESLRIEGTARAAAGEAGVMGASVDALLRDLQGQSARARDREMMQYEWSQFQLGRERLALGRSRSSQIAGLQRGQKPNLMAHLLGTGASK